MSLIKIFKDDLELDVVKKTLTIKRENDAFTTDFKVAHSSVPFLVVENENTVNTLGPRDINSINKKKVVAVSVFELGEKYAGELQIIGYIKGFRKCNLKYASDILPLLNQKISSFMPTVSVIPEETDPVPYVPESNEIIPGAEHWPSYPLGFLDNHFPQAKWQFPTMRWYNKFGVDLDVDDEWFDFKDHINKYDNDGNLINNEGSVDEMTDIVTAHNYNVVSPQVFLLSPLYYIFNSIGYTIEGDLVNHPFIRRLLMLSTKDNLTKILLQPEGIFLDFSGLDWILEPFNNFKWRKTIEHEMIEAGNYTLKYRFVIKKGDNNFFDIKYTRFSVDPPGSNNLQVEFSFNPVENNGQNYIFEGEVSFLIDDDQIGQDLKINFLDSRKLMPLEYELELKKTDGEKVYYQTHPTIEFGRYVPEWTVAKYLNELKNFFNLNITPDDNRKKITLNFNERINDIELPEVVNKSLLVEGYDAVANTSFTLKYGNDEDVALFITTEGAEIFATQTDDFNKVQQSEFKFVPNNYYTAELSEAVADKNGVGLMIYNPTAKPYISQNYLGNTLKIEGSGGIYETFWKKWLKFRLNASALEISGPFTEVEFAKINKANALYIDNQHYRIVDVEMTEVNSTINNIKFNLESVNY